MGPPDGATVEKRRLQQSYHDTPRARRENEGSESEEILEMRIYSAANPQKCRTCIHAKNG